MTPEMLRVLINTALAAGCGGLITWLMDQIKKWREEDGKLVSPKTARRVVLLLCAVVPTALYVFTALVGWQAYDFVMNAAYVVTAFTSSTMIHGETQLPNGAEVRLRKQGLIDKKGR